MRLPGFALPAIVLAGAVLLVSQPAPPERPGPNPDGGVTLVSGWKLRPAGRQIPLSTFPMSSLISPDGKYLLVLQGGYLKPSISVHRLPGMVEVHRVELDDAWLGMAFAPGGNGALYVSGGSRSCVYEYALDAGGRLEQRRSFEIVPGDKREWQDFAGDVQLSPDGRLIYVAMLYRNTVAVINPQSGMVIEQFKTGLRPYRILFHPDGKSFFVTSWADGSLYHHDALDGRQLWRLPLGSALMDLVWRDKKTEVEESEEFPYAGRVFVTASNTNQVHVVGLTSSKEPRRIETINVSLAPLQPAGMTPSALALSPAQDRLFVVCSDANAVAVVNVSGAKSVVRGFIPTGWYPVAARELPSGELVVLNGKGERSLPNPQGPNPSKRAAPAYLGNSAVEYVGRIQKGTMSVIEGFEDRLAEHAKTVLAGTPYRDSALQVTAAGLPPAEHIVYIIKENRTYDQVLGDLGIGNGDPSLTLFGQNVTPNHHKLAREFVLLDNFYVSADVSADGHNWSTAAIAPAYVQRLWPNSYGARRRHYDYEGGEPAALPPAGYLWTNAAQKGITIRNYGWWATNITPPPAEGPQIRAVRDPILAKSTCMEYRNFDMDYPDLERVKPFLKELADSENTGNFPRLVFLKIPNDHTSGTAVGKISALSAVADNDAALGMVIEALSKSRFWPKMAIFILEDDAQNGPDHVDSHRSPAYIISPWTRGRGIDSSMYNTTSMLRTMELMLGLRPMTQFDAAARPMFASFNKQPDTRPYSAEKARIPLDERNPANTPTAARSARLDFSEADRIDDEELNDILWRSIKKTEPPVPVRSYFGK
jgi:YVTN family beta-propeller protein